MKKAYKSSHCFVIKVERIKRQNSKLIQQLTNNNYMDIVLVSPVHHVPFLGAGNSDELNKAPECNVPLIIDGCRPKNYELHECDCKLKRFYRNLIPETW